MDKKTFEGKVVLVTGANAGIGETAATMFRDAGAKVFAVARRKEALDAARAKHHDIHWVLADTSNASQIVPAVEAVVREAGKLDVVVNNAAVFMFGPLEGSTEQMVRAQLEVNVLGPTLVARAALPALKESRGCIVNVGSAAGHKPAPGGSIYAATKAALESLTRSWALELAPAGIRVNLVAPGPTETPGFAKMGPSPEVQAMMRAAFLKGVPLARVASTEEIARWILDVARPDVTWMTGAILAIDGGMSLT